MKGKKHTHTHREREREIIFLDLAERKGEEGRRGWC